MAEETLAEYARRKKKEQEAAQGGPKPAPANPTKVWAGNTGKSLLHDTIETPEEKIRKRREKAMKSLNDLGVGIKHVPGKGPGETGGSYQDMAGNPITPQKAVATGRGRGLGFDESVGVEDELTQTQRQRRAKRYMSGGKRMF